MMDRIKRVSGLILCLLLISAVFSSCGCKGKARLNIIVYEVDVDGTYIVKDAEVYMSCKGVPDPEIGMDHEIKFGNTDYAGKVVFSDLGRKTFYVKAIKGEKEGVVRATISNRQGETHIAVVIE